MVPTFARTTLTTLLRVQSTNPDILRRGRFLNTLLVGLIALTALFIPLQLLDGRIPETLAVTATLIVMASALYLSWRGHPTPAAYLFVAACWAGISMIMFTRPAAAGAFGFAPFMFAIPIIVAGVTASRRAAFGVAAPPPPARPDPSPPEGDQPVQATPPPLILSYEPHPEGWLVAYSAGGKQ